jgi:hypothetical protein
MRKVVLIAFLTLGLAACVDEGDAASDPEAVKLSDADRAQCLAQGGTVGRGGLLPDEVCFRPTPDAGKACTKAGDCSGQCMADTMTCSKVTPQFGCFEMMTEDGQKVGLCVD